MSDETRLRVAGDDVVHQALFAGALGGQTRCRLTFAWQPDESRPTAVALATETEDDCDCMTCLATVDALGQFVTYRRRGSPSSTPRASRSWSSHDRDQSRRLR